MPVLTIQNYVRAGSLEEAYALCQKKNNVVLGGMLWLKMQRETAWDTAIDLSGLGLDQIEETDSEYRLGAMVTPAAAGAPPRPWDRLTQGAMAESVRHIVGGAVPEPGHGGGERLRPLRLLRRAHPAAGPGGPGGPLPRGGAVPGGLRRRPPAAGHPHPTSLSPRGSGGWSICPSGTPPPTSPSSPAPCPGGRGRTLCAVGARPGRGGGPLRTGRGFWTGGSPRRGPRPLPGRAAGTLPVREQSPGAAPNTARRSARCWSAGACWPMEGE